jgi:hypothetical protein
MNWAHLSDPKFITVISLGFWSIERPDISGLDLPSGTFNCSELPISGMGPDKSSDGNKLMLCLRGIGGSSGMKDESSAECRSISYNRGSGCLSGMRLVSSMNSRSFCKRKASERQYRLMEYCRGEGGISGMCESIMIAVIIDRSTLNEATGFGRIQK